mmetsp:Transcript_26873/g.23662  ORF Transcript_26873/g.23662 Transcript_26873/m.23662 type:complete len:243 (+) Transcript_26873:40-768(+)
MDEVNSLHYDETPKAKFIRYIIWGMIGIFTITVTIISLVHGFGDAGQQGHAFLGIACFCFTLTTFFLQFKITTGDLSDAARIPVYLQLAITVFFGVSILITVYSNWHPPELDCYYDTPNTFVRSSDPGSGTSECWKPPSCFKSSSSCLMYLSAGGIGDQCATNKPVQNETAHTTTYTCSYVYHNPTPKPTPPPVTTTTPPPASANAIPPKSANNINAYEKSQSDSELLGYLNEYYANYQKED